MAENRDTPIPPFDVPTCLARSARHKWYPGGQCNFPRELALSAAVFEAEQASAAGLQGVRFIDMTPGFCDDHICSAARDGLIVYRDDNHITGSFASSRVSLLGPQRVEALAIH